MAQNELDDFKKYEAKQTSGKGMIVLVLSILIGIVLGVMVIKYMGEASTEDTNHLAAVSAKVETLGAEREAVALDLTVARTEVQTLETDLNAKVKALECLNVEIAKLVKKEIVVPAPCDPSEFMPKPAEATTEAAPVFTQAQ